MKIADLILEHVNRDYLLPSIQREFVWGRNNNKIENLFDSIMQGYPIGIFLKWVYNKEVEEDNVGFDIYEFIKNYNEENPHNELANINGYTQLNLILDGQQRITALCIGLIGSYSYSYYNNIKRTKLYLNLVSDIENDQDNYYGLKYEFKFFENPPNENGSYWFKVGEVLDYKDEDAEVFKSEYKDKIYDIIKEEDKRNKALAVLGVLHNRICDSRNFINELEFSGNDEKALNVFVRANDGGVKLEKADLLLSFMEAKKDYFQPNGARKEIYDFVDELNTEKVNKPNYRFEKDDILKSCLVLSDLDVQYRLKNFNDVNLNIISNNWNDIKYYLLLTVKLVASYGFSRKNIISKNALIPIAYYLLKSNKKEVFINSKRNTDILIKNEIIEWFVYSQLVGAFGGSSDSTLQKVRKQLKDGTGFKNIKLGKVIDKERIEKWLQKETYQSKYSHLLLMLITKENYWDKCNQDHIFPRSKFDDEEYSKMNLTDEQIDFYESNADSILNIQLINDKVNFDKSNDDFINWSSEHNNEYLESLLIPTNIDYDFNNFEKFISERRDLMLKKLCEVLPVDDK